MIKVVTFFLIGMVILALFGRLRLPGNLLGKRSRRGNGATTLDAHKCPRCGSHVIGNGPCDCNNDDPKRT